MKTVTAMLLVWMVAGAAGFGDAVASEPELSSVVFYVG